MRTQYVTHACLFHEAGDDRILTDPWFATPAYLNQWHVHPQPGDDSVLERASALLISHGHEDHLHVPTLKRANKSATVLYPRQPDGDASGFFKDVMGLDKHVELRGQQEHVLPGGTRVLPVPVGHDCIFVVSHGDHVLVNVNDALHAAEATLIEKVCAWLKARFPKIDAVFCGFGGASYFPNCFHHPNKDDRSIAVVREALFARNFCLIAARLAPRVAVPFAADFHLLHESLAWINETRFAREKMPALFATLFPDAVANTRIEPMLPGQWLEADGTVTGEPQAGAAPSFEAYRGTTAPVHEVVRDYAALIQRNLEQLTIPAACLPLTIEVTTDEASHWIAVRGGSDTPTANVVEARPDDTAVDGRIGADSAEYLLGLDWHSDVVVIGYGMEFSLGAGVTPTPAIVHALGDVVTHYPKVKRDLIKRPLRTTKWILSNHEARHRIASRIGRKGRSSFADVGSDEWLSLDAPELARRLGIPSEFVEQTPAS